MPHAPEKFIERSVDSLQKIYAVIVALAIGQAIQTISGNPSEILSHLPGFLAFVAIVVPFYHGMNRHLDKCYIERTENVVQGALLFDFIVFFSLASLLFVFSTSIKTGLQSFVILGGLLVVDSVWALVSHWIHYRGFVPSILRWSVINSIILVAALFIYVLQVYDDGTKCWLLLVLAIIRTICDYKFCWNFYFPQQQSAAPTIA
jgi:predicted membrane protein